jgi:hypothetical protein
MGWNTEGVKTNPTAGDTLADSGPLSAALKTFTIAIWNDTGGGELEVVQRNALDTADVAVQRITVAGTTLIYPWPVLLVLNQRVIVRLRQDLTGHIQASLLA